MAPVRLSSDALQAFCNCAATANVSYHASRRNLFDLFTAAISPRGDVTMSPTSYLSVRTFLSSRTAVDNDSARLAYEVALMECSDALQALKEVEMPVPSPPSSFDGGPAAHIPVVPGYPYGGPGSHPTE